MKSVKHICTALFLGICLLLMAPGPVGAAENKVIDRVEIEIDVPVNGVALKQTAAVNEYFKGTNMMSKVPNTGTSVGMVIWYKTTDPGVPLSSGYKAKLGESYNVDVFITAKSGYSISDNIYLSNNKINGQKADAFSATAANGKKGWLFSVRLDTIQAVSGKPIVTIQDMELSPYEGNPMEVVVNATGTNLKYQWQVVYGDGPSDWGGEVDLDDNEVYVGTKTPHFKLHTCFGDTIDEDMDFAKVRCKVTGDNGTAYSQEVWFAIRDRTVVNTFNITNLEKPVYGAKADYAVTSSASDKYNCTRIVWYGPKGSDGAYSQMGKSETFAEGEYFCRIYVSTTEAYKFDINTKAYVNGSRMPFNIISGKSQYPHTADSYYIEVIFSVEAPEEDEVIKNVAVTGVKLPVAGDNMTSAEYTTATVGSKEAYSVSSVDWFDSNGNNPLNKIFEAGRKYMVRVILEPEEGYQFDLEGTTTVTLNGHTTTLDKKWSDGTASLVYIFTAEAAEVKDPDINPFTDVKESYFYYNAVLWAVKNGVTSGITETVFGPDEICTRAQAVTFLWRSAGKPEPAGVENPFVDIKSDSYYYKAVLWAVEEGITTGTSSTTFSPGENCSRSQIVTFLWRAHGKEIVAAANPFKDVGNKNYYYNAVLWAVKNNITTGIEKDIFSPDTDCTRGQIVTFLYRSVQ